MSNFTDTRLWKGSLERQPDDPLLNCPRAKLRVAFFTFRERAEALAAEIALSLPDFTVHDVNHIDALWQMADILAGERLDLTPTEAFVLGGAFLVHDLGNGLAAYTEGLPKLKSNQRWPDTIAALLRRRLGRAPSPDEMLHPDADIESDAMEELLRHLHAQHAERLAHVSWTDSAGGGPYWLIDNPDLRADFGSLIGEVAHSHWWPVEKLHLPFARCEVRRVGAQKSGPLIL